MCWRTTSWSPRRRFPPAVQGSSYTAAVEASGGVPPYTWTLQSGALPAGIGLDGATGTLSGTATESGDFPVTIRVTDAIPGTADVVVELALHVESAGPPALAITPPGPLVATIGTSASIQLSATGGTPPYRWAASGVDVGLENSLPNDITLEQDGRLTGVAGYPAGTYHFSIDVYDAAHAQAHLLADLVVQAPSGLHVITDPLPPGGVIGEPYSFQFQAAGGAPPYTWTILQDAPPPDGLVLAADGTLSGTPTRGNETIKVQVTDAVGATAFAVVPLSIVPPPLAVPPFNFPDAVVDRHYEFFMNVTGPPSAWTVSAGALPPGLGLVRWGIAALSWSEIRRRSACSPSSSR